MTSLRLVEHFNKSCLSRKDSNATAHIGNRKYSKNLDKKPKRMFSKVKLCKLCSFPLCFPFWECIGELHDCVVG